MYNSSNNNITSNNVSTSGSDSFGIFLDAEGNSNSNNLISNRITTNGSGAYGIYLNSSMNGNVDSNTIASNRLNISNADRIYFYADFSCSNNSFTNNSIINRNYSYYDINFASAGANGNWFIDQYIENYTFAGAGETINVKDSQFGEIVFLNAVNGSGGNFSNDIKILNNSAYVNSSAASGGFNRSANITLYGIGNRGYSNPAVLRNSVFCSSTTSPSCFNFTSLTAVNVKFNVSSWTNYSIGEGPDTIYPIFYSYWDNNASIIYLPGGTALFNVSVNNTNGTVLLQINNANYTAHNLSANVYNVSVSGLINGNYNYYWMSWGNGSSHLFNISGTRYYTVNASDSIYPVVNITYPFGINYNINVSTLNYTVVETNPSRCWYSNSSGIWNSTSVAAGINFTSVVSKEGSNTWTVYCNDTVNNINSSSIIFFKDTVYPVINITYPINNSYYNFNTVNINYTYTDSNLGSCWYSNDSYSVNITVSNCANITNIVWSEGQHNVSLWANDSAGNINSSRVMFYVDLTNPQISSFSCSPLSVYVGGVITCSCSATDNMDANPAVSYTVNPITSGAGTFTTTCIATDKGGNYALSSINYDVQSSGTCTINWVCEEYGSCINEQQTRNCVNSGTCLPHSKTENKTCQTEENPTPPGGDGGGGAGGAGAEGGAVCENWSECHVIYDVEDIIDEKILLKGEQTRICKGVTNKIERRACDTKILVNAQKIKKCFKDYLEVYDLNNTLILRLEYLNGTYKALNIQFKLDNSEYCDYCYDGIKNYDEDEVDCVYKEKASCSVCRYEKPSKFPWIFWILLILLIILIIWIIYKKIKSNKSNRKKNLHIKASKNK